MQIPRHSTEETIGHLQSYASFLRPNRYSTLS